MQGYVLSLISFFFLFLYSPPLEAQLPYTEVQYEIWADTSIYYGSAINYAGNSIDLFMDIYKPIGDNNRYRPLVILSFGGAWIAGDRRNTDITSVAPWFVSRGYAVAAIDYRLGFHPSTGNGSNWATCPAVTQESNCVYPADSSEMIRAIYRGMQDLKGAIRFLKSRNNEDSTCVNNVFIAGVSAGGFNTIAAGFLDSPDEKPLSAFALPDADAPNTLSYCHDYFNESDQEISRARPDLGSIEGDIAINSGYNAEVKGVVNFIGGMLSNYFAIESGESPLLYTHHQTSDLIVSCNRTPILSSLSNNCLAPFGFLGCNHIWNTPWAYGSCGIVSLLEQNASITSMDMIAQTGGPNCIQDPPGHSIVNPQQRVSEIAEFFSATIVQNEIDGCDIVTTQTLTTENQFAIYPNPASDMLAIEFKDSNAQADIKLFDLSGKIIPIKVLKSNGIYKTDLQAVDQGVYLLKVGTSFRRIIICR